MSWGSFSNVHIKELETIHRHAVRVLRATSQMFPGQGHISLDLLPLKQHLQDNNCILMHKVVHNKSPLYLRQLLHTGTLCDPNSRNCISVLPKTKTDLSEMSFSYSGSSSWKALPSNLKNACSINTFRYKIVQHLQTVCDT